MGVSVSLEHLVYRVSCTVVLRLHKSCAQTRGRETRRAMRTHRLLKMCMTSSWSPDRPVIAEGPKPPESHRKVARHTPRRGAPAIPASSEILRKLQNSCSAFIRSCSRKPFWSDLGTNLEQLRPILVDGGKCWSIWAKLSEHRPKLEFSPGSVSLGQRRPAFRPETPNWPNSGPSRPNVAQHARFASHVGRCSAPGSKNSERMPSNFPVTSGYLTSFCHHRPLWERRHLHSGTAK